MVSQMVLQDPKVAAQQKLTKTYSYTYTSHGSDKINLFESCMAPNNNEEQNPIETQINNLEKRMELSLSNTIDVISEECADLPDENSVDYIIGEAVSLPIQECTLQFHRAEAPFMPLTFTTYRSIAYKKFKSLMITQIQQGQPVPLDKLTSHFCRKVDLEILDKKFYQILVEQYHNKIRKHNLNEAYLEKMPKQMKEHLEIV